MRTLLLDNWIAFLVIGVVSCLSISSFVCAIRKRQVLTAISVSLSYIGFLCVIVTYSFGGLCCINANVPSKARNSVSTRLRSESLFMQQSRFGALIEHEAGGKPSSTEIITLRWLWDMKLAGFISCVFVISGLLSNGAYVSGYLMGLRRLYCFKEIPNYFCALT